MDDRRKDLVTFYDILEGLEKTIAGARCLDGCDARMDWPRRGVYFFREHGEQRSNTGFGPRIVRVGTHALKADSGTKLWSRLAQHKGRSNGTGNRGSVLRLIIGSSALTTRHGYRHPSWGRESTAKVDIRRGELALEKEVSAVIGKMPAIWLSIDDDDGPASLRGYVERNAIALLGNYGKAGPSTRRRQVGLVTGLTESVSVLRGCGTRIMSTRATPLTFSTRSSD